METKKAKSTKRKKELPVSTSSPLESIEPPPLATRRKSTAGADELQEKRMKAAIEFVGQHWEIDQSSFDLVPAPGQSVRQAYEDLETRVWGNHIYCTPLNVMFRLGGQWFQVTSENVAKVAKEHVAAEEVRPESYAKIALHHVRQWAKRVGRVGWVLPRLEKEVVSK
jgi:hypothetical protein